MKRILSLILSVCLLCALFVTPAFAGAAYNSDVTVSAALDKTELTTSSSAQTVELTIKTSKKVDLFSIGYKVQVPTGWSITGIESGSSEIGYSLETGHYSLSTGVVSWYIAVNKSTNDNGTIGKITISVPANAEAKSYTINVTGIELGTKGENNDNAWMSDGTASATVTITAFNPSKEATPNATFTATGDSTGTLTGVTSGMKYSTDGTTWKNINSTSVNLTGLSAGTIQIKKSGNGTTTTDSDAQSITVTKASTPNLTVTQPTTIGGTGSVATTTAHQFSTNGTTWTNCTGATTNLAAGTYYVRVKATGTVLASDPQTVTITAKAVSSIAVETPPTKTEYNAGESFNAAGMVITVTYNDGSSEDISTGFTVSPSGALTMSDTTVTISYGGKTTTVNITVNAVPVTGVSLNKSSTTIEVGSSETLTATVAPANATNKAVTWSSSNPSVATVDNGKVTGVAEGTATITVTTADGGKTATCSVTVEKGSDRVLVSRNAVSFTDVAQGAYYYDAVKWAVKNGVTEGKTANRFDPNGPVTRAQAVTFLWRAAGCPKVNYFMKFTDLKAGAYYTEAVRWAVAMGITKGVDETHFNPDATCTRAQIVSFLYRYAKASSVSAANPFTDVKAGAYYYDAVLWAVKNGITGGKTATTFAPAETCNRAQVVTFLYRYMAK